MNPPLTHNEPTSIRETRTLSLSFLFPHGDWCEAIFNETTGTFTINADAGVYSYCWTLGSNLGIKPPYTLLRGVHGFGIDYLVNKLCHGNEARAYDEEGTRRAVLKEALERFSNDEVEEALEDTNFETEDSFMYTAPSWLEEPHFLMEFGPTRKYQVLTERYLPAIKRWVADRVERDDASAGEESL